MQLHEEAAVQGVGRFHAFEDDVSYLGVVSHCRVVRHGAPPLERTSINWLGSIAAVFFLIGVFFGSAGILGRIDRRRAGLVTGACVLICVTCVAVFFA